MSHNCITEEQSQFIQRQRAKRYKNEKILFVMESLDERSFSKFLKCLRQTNQKTVAKIVDDGGGLKCKLKLETLLVTNIYHNVFFKLLKLPYSSLFIEEVIMDRQSRD